MTSQSVNSQLGVVGPVWKPSHSGVGGPQIRGRPVILPINGRMFLSTLEILGSNVSVGRKRKSLRTFVLQLIGLVISV